MSLNKGFLGNSNKAFAKRWILTGILLGLNLALVLYAFSIQLRESFRILTHFFVGHLLILNTSERLFYDLFYAVISSIVGFSFALKFITENSRNRHDPKVKLSQTTIINNHNFTTWHTLNWAAKVFLITGIWFISIIMHFDIDFYNELYWFFILLPPVWFLNLWLGMHRLLGRKTFRWMVISALVIATSSFLLIQLEVVDSNKIDKQLLKNTIAYNYDVDIPETRSYSQLDYSNYPIDLYVGFSKNEESAEVKIIGDNSEGRFNELAIDELRLHLIREMDKLSFHGRINATVRLFIDERVEMYTVYLISQEIARSGIYNIFYQTDPENSTYPPHHPPYFKYGIKRKAPFNCDCAIDKIESLKMLGYSSRQIRFPETYCYRMAHIYDYNRLKVNIDVQDNLLLNNRPISYKRLKDILYKFEDSYYKNSLIILDADGESSYGRYIEILDLIRSAIIYKRNELAMGNFNLPYFYSERLWEGEKKKMEIIEELVPINILEMTYTDKHLYDFVKGKN